MLQACIRISTSSVSIDFNFNICDTSCAFVLILKTCEPIFMGCYFNLTHVTHYLWDIILILMHATQYLCDIIFNLAHVTQYLWDIIFNLMHATQYLWDIILI